MTDTTSVFGRRKLREGVVVSDKMEKTIVVAVQSNIRHKLYKKTIRRVKKYMAHDETEQAKMGDLVRIAEAAPVSKRKRWQLVQVLEKAELPEVAAREIDLELLGEVKREEPEAPEAAPAPAVTAAPAPEPAPVMEDAGEQALETMETAHEEGTSAPAEPETPEIEEAGVVEASAPEEATKEE
jgi:small subunit ribosomal protein S17